MPATSTPEIASVITTSWPYTKLILAFIVGAIGSAAYITALYFKFIGDTEINRKVVMRPFMRYVTVDGVRCSKMNIYKCLWYSSIGGFIAVIFQFDVPNFVSVQSLILGATWPAIVSQFLSGRMVSATKTELEEFRDLVPPPVDVESLKRKIEDIKVQEDNKSQGS